LVDLGRIKYTWIHFKETGKLKSSKFFIIKGFENNLLYFTTQENAINDLSSVGI